MCACKWTWSYGPDGYIRTLEHHYHSSIVVAVEKGTLRKWLSCNETLEVCRARRTWCEAHAGTVLYDEFGMSSSRVAQQACPIIDGGSLLE